jgi:hypothetical protein
MKRTAFTLICSLLFSFSQLLAQQYTAAEYWRMEHDSAYIRLEERQKAGDTLSFDEQKYITDYKILLSGYFEKLPDTEKSLYYKYRAQWNSQPPVISEKGAIKQEADVYAGERSMYTQYLVASGFFGALYGGAAVAVLGLGESGDGGAAVGIPLLTAGASVLIPILTIKDKIVPYNSLALSTHGKIAGGLQGAALGVLITGDNVEDGKLILALATASSIGLGRLGYSLGKNKPWSQGRAALYSYYGLLMPLEGLALDAAFQIEDPRIYGLTSLAFGAGGYLIANQVANKNDFTKGDITATGTLATLNGLLGLLILTDIGNNSDDISSWQIMIPAIGALGGTLIGHVWLKDARFTIQQGRNVALASAGGAAIGLGLAALFTPETATPYYVTSYITAMTTYAIMVGMYKKNNILRLSDNEKKTRWNINVMPQNIFLNKKIADYAFANPGRRIDFLPAFSAAINF